MFNGKALCVSSAIFSAAEKSFCCNKLSTTIFKLKPALIAASLKSIPKNSLIEYATQNI